MKIWTVNKKNIRIACLFCCKISCFIVYDCNQLRRKLVSLFPHKFFFYINYWTENLRGELYVLILSSSLHTDLKPKLLLFVWADFRRVEFNASEYSFVHLAIISMCYHWYQTLTPWRIHWHKAWSTWKLKMNITATNLKLDQNPLNHYIFWSFFNA